MAERDPASSPPPGRRDPSVPLLLLAMFSTVLPIVGIVLLAWGGYEIAAGGDAGRGWLLVLAGSACIALDILIDVVFAIPDFSRSSEPTLNRRGSELIGRQAIVVEPIAEGRGKVRIDDTVWIAEGPDLAAGRDCKVVQVRDVVLIVAAASEADGVRPAAS